MRRQEEARLVTALFADISGFTALAETLDTEALHEVITPVVRGLGETAQKYGGFVEKYAGDALLVVFGAPVTHEDDPQRALLAALEMHARLPDLLLPLGPLAAHLSIHVGVNTGRVIARQVGPPQQSDYAVLGDAVILAQRLESVCPPGQTYVGASTQELTGDAFVFEALPPLSLKGKAAPVAAYRLVGPRRAESAESRPLVGRERELAELEAVLDEVCEGRGGLLTLLGEAGAGKSRLLSRFREVAERRGTTCWEARGLSYGAAVPYWPFADLLRRVCGIDPAGHPLPVPERLAELVSPEHLGGALLLLGLSADVPPPREARRAVHDAVVDWLCGALRTRPLVLLLEDLHWIDSASADLLREILVRVPALAVVATARPGVAELAPGDGATRRQLVVEALPREGVAALAQAVLGARPGDVLTNLLVDRTGGNPLFVEELAGTLVESGALVLSATGVELRPGRDETDVPTTVEQVFATRVDALSPAAAGLLQVASVIGRVVPLPLLRLVTSADALRELTTLLEAGMLEQTADRDVVTFQHALLQDVVHGRLLRRRRRELHQGVADAARALYGDGDETIDLVARHLYLAQAGSAAADALLRAGRRASALYANDEAVLHLTRAVEVLQQLGEQVPVALQLELAGLQEARGAYDEALELYRSVRSTTGVGAAWRGELAVLRARGRYEEALALWEQARDSGVRAPELELERGTTLINAGRHVEASDVLQQALRTAPDPRLASRLASQLARALMLAGEQDRSLHLAQEAVAHAQSAGDLREETTALRMLGDVLRSRHTWEPAAEALERALLLARRTGTVDEEAGLLLNLGLLELERGDPSAALLHNEQAIRVFERLGHGSGLAVGYGNLAWTVLELGRVEECLEWCARACEQARGIGHLGTLADVARTRAHALLRLGRTEQGAASAREAAEVFGRMGLIEDRDACLALAESGSPG